MTSCERIATALAIALLAMFAFVGCSEDEPTEPAEGSGLDFTYGGDRSGSYTSEGVPSIGSGGLPEVDSWAIARPDSLGGMVIAAFEPGGETTGDLFILQLHPIGTGEFTPCNINAGEGCHGRLIIGVDIEDFTVVEEWFEIASGSVTLTEASSTRVRGTFSITLENLDQTQTITVTDGVIDVPFSNDPQLSHGLSCLARNLRDGTNEPC
ncbi:MAG: hypothetical protein PVJ43_10785 [Gemmatimonadales bacterium]|jgi:hypothetical protein